MIVLDTDNKPHKQNVKVGIRNGDDVQITEGLKGGERVVTVGAFELDNEDDDVLAKTKIQVQAPKTAGRGRRRGRMNEQRDGLDCSHRASCNDPMAMNGHARSSTVPSRPRAGADRGPIALLVRPPLEIDHLSGAHPGGCRHLRSASRIPIAVFPATNFPRIIIGVDNGVMPIDQMEVTITRPIEEAVNSVPGLEDVRSTTSRGSAEVDLSFNWSVDMAQTLQQVNAAIARIQSTLPSTAQIETPPPGFREFPDPRLQPHLGQGSANAALGTGDLRHSSRA